MKCEDLSLFCFPIADPEMQYKIAQYHLDSIGEPGKNSTYVKHNHWLKKAAEQGHVEAQFTLGLNFGWVEEDYKLAEYWLKKAHQNGHPEAVKELLLLGTLDFEEYLSHLGNEG